MGLSYDKLVQRREKREKEVVYDYLSRWYCYGLDYGEVVKPHEPGEPFEGSEALKYIMSILGGVKRVSLQGVKDCYTTKQILDILFCREDVK